jgi:hypothetical protein
MDDGAKTPGPDETLDAPVYEPRRKRLPILPIVVTVAAAAILVFVLKVERVGVREPPNIRFTIRHLTFACEAYRDRTGECPWPPPPRVQADTTISTREVYAALLGLPVPLLDGMPKEFVKDGTLVDHWGRELMIRVDPKTRQPVIWSCGLNGIDETNDGDSPDPTKFPKGYYWFGKGDTGDDISVRR